MCIDGGVGGLVVADAFAERLRGVQEADAQHEAHEEAADMGEVVEAREQAEDEGDGDVEEDEDKVFDGGTPG